jgi:hypothetical protein
MTTTDQDLIDQKIRDKFETIFYDRNIIEGDLARYEPSSFFSIESVRNAAKEITEKKAMGNDCWSVKLFTRKGPEADLLCDELAHLINDGVIPEYCREARICPLSKTGKQGVTVDEIRPISIQSHVRKIIEQMIKQLLEDSQSDLLTSLDYQRGFKPGKSTHSNLAEILGVVTEDVNKRRAGIRSFLSVDLSKAYDRVIRGRMFEVLRAKAKTPVEKKVVMLLERMY